MYLTAFVAFPIWLLWECESGTLDKWNKMKRKPRKRLLSDHNTRRPGSSGKWRYIKKLTEEEVCAIIIHLGAVAYFCEINTIMVCIRKEE